MEARTQRRRCEIDAEPTELGQQEGDDDRLGVKQRGETVRTRTSGSPLRPDELVSGDTLGTVSRVLQPIVNRADRRQNSIKPVSETALS